MGLFSGLSLGKALLGGIGSIFKGKSQRKAAEADAKNAKEIKQMEINWQREALGIEDRNARERAKEEALLTEWMRQNRRSEVARGSKNFSQFSGAMPEGYERKASANEQQYSPDEYITARGLVGNLARQAAPQTQSPETPVAPWQGSIVEQYRNDPFQQIGRAYQR